MVFGWSVVCCIVVLHDVISYYICCVGVLVCGDCWLVYSGFSVYWCGVWVCGGGFV